MKKYLIISVLIITSLKVFSQNEIKGVWLNQDKDAEIQITEKNNKYYGKIIWLLNPKDEEGKIKTDSKNPDKTKQNQHLMGLEILKDLKYSKKEWSKGVIYDPKSGKTYKLSAKIKNSKLYLRGYIGVSLVGKTNIWTRPN
tara:strand:+ start:4180 stop:4602 length:423 start_codon:yes stop_codon:yes gene_type:complete